MFVSKPPRRGTAPCIAQLHQGGVPFLRLCESHEMVCAIGKAVQGGHQGILAALRLAGGLPSDLLPRMLPSLQKAITRGHAEVIGQLHAAGWKLATAGSLTKVVAIAIESGHADVVRSLSKAGWPFHSQIFLLKRSITLT